MPIDEKEIEEKVRRIIAEKYGLDPSELRPEMRFIEDLGADSLDLVELAMALEEEFSTPSFKIKIPDEEAEEILSEVRKYICRQSSYRRPKAPERP